MRKLFAFSCSISLWFVLNWTTLLVSGQGTTVTLSPGVYQEISAPSGQLITVSISSVPSSAGYALVQAHSVLGNITLSQTTTPRSDQSTTGSSIGLVLTPDTNKVYLLNQDALPSSVLLLLQVYDQNAPIPGGCNMELAIKTAPFLPTSFTPNLLIVQYPLGSWPKNVEPATCDRAPLQYDVYLYYLPERDFSVQTAFSSLKLMGNVSSVEKYGRKVSFFGIPPSQLKFANYPGTGRIVTVILRTLTDSAMYVPSLSYGCSASGDSGCDVLSSTGSKLLSAGLLFAGLFLLSLGHRWFKCQLFLLGGLLTAVLAYILLLLFSGQGTEVAFTTATVVGAVGGAVWVTIWAKCGTPIGFLFLASFALGLLFAGLIAFTPLADLAIMKEELTFWLAFFCLVMSVPLAIISFDKLTSILVSAVLGAYMFVVPVDHFVGSCLKYIFINVVRRASDPDFGTAIVQPPFQINDWILSATWIILAVSGIIFQLWRERGRPPFPPPPGPWDWPGSGSRSRVEGQGQTQVSEATPLLHSQA